MIVRQLGRVEYVPTYSEMQSFTEKRTPDTPDELWLCEHPPVFTQGLAGRAEHLLMPGSIPVVQTNRGGQVTYHGPGQVVAYPLIDLRRRGIGVKELVYRYEQVIIQTHSAFGVDGRRIANVLFDLLGQFYRLVDCQRESGHKLVGRRPLAKPGNDRPDRPSQRNL